MLTINEYRKVESLEEAYELNQKKNNKIIAGGVWMKIGDRRIATASICQGLGWIRSPRRIQSLSSVP